MSNPVFTDVVFVGDKREVRSFYGKMKRLQEREKPLVNNSHYYPQRWLGNLVARLGENCREVFCGGMWNSLARGEDFLEFSTETAWHPPFALFRMIQRHYPSLRFYFEPDIEYFDTILEACAYLSAFTGWEIKATWEALQEAAEAWNDEHRNADWPVGVKQIELIGNDELWE